MSQPNDPQPPPLQNSGDPNNPFKAPEQHAPVAPIQETASPLDGFFPTNPLAAISCYTGIIGMITCFGGIVLGPIAILLGILGLKAWKVQESQYGKTMSSVRAWIGIVTGAIGFVLGVVVIAMMILNR